MKQFQPANASDTHLLRRFEEDRDQRAFAELVRRYGPMVLATARRILRRPEDVEDAFQATMFALAKASRKLRKKAAVAGWLHKTTYRCAAEICRANGRWKKNVYEMVQRQNTAMSTKCVEANPLLGVANDELERMLDDEIVQLSEPLRDVIVLCELQGMPQKAAAKRLGVPTSTVNDRVARGRRLLHQRLVRRGATLTLAGISSRAGTSDASAAISETFVKDTATKATLYADGKSAADIGVSASVVHTAKVITTMATAKIIAALAAAIVIFSFASFSGIRASQHGSTFSATVFYDDFEDGEPTNKEPATRAGIPVIWQPYGDSKIEISKGKLVTSGSSYGLAVTSDQDNRASRLMLDDMSIRTRARLLEGNAVVVNPLRKYEGPRPGYLGLIGDGFARILYGGTLEVIKSATTDFNISQEPLMIQFDAFGDELRLWIWRPGEAMPKSPVLSVIDDAIPTIGMGDIGVGTTGRPSRAEFEFIHVATTSISDESP